MHLEQLHERLGFEFLLVPDVLQNYIGQKSTYEHFRHFELVIIHHSQLINYEFDEIPKFLKKLLRLRGHLLLWVARVRLLPKVIDEFFDLLLPALLMLTFLVRKRLVFFIFFLIFLLLFFWGLRLFLILVVRKTKSKTMVERRLRE